MAALHFALMQVIFPGTFDPPTNGHLDIIQRAVHLFDRVVIVVADNRRKTSMFSAAERSALVKELASDFENAEVHIWDGLIVEFAEREGIGVLLRGVRALADFEYEFELSLMNRALSPTIETLMLPTDTKNVVVRSSAIKEIAQFGGDISNMVPAVVSEAVRAKLRLVGDA
jgi:pantetheine-phosphate adenylyltransferase